MKKVIRFLNLLSILIYLTNCKKEPIHYTISDDFRKWVDCQNGSYWVYKNELTGNIDSVYFLGDRLYSTDFSYKEQGYSFDFININLKSSFIQSIYISVNADFEFAILDVRGMGSALRTNSEIGQNIKWINGIYRFVNFYDSLKINNNIFHNIIHTRTSLPYHSTNDSIVCNFYFSKNIGLIKFQSEVQISSADTSWSLLRWNVIQ